MKKYFLGDIEIKNIELLRNTLNKNGLELVGIQRSLAHLSDYTNECEQALIYGDDRYINNENLYGEFELPLFDNINILQGIANIKGVGTELIEDDEVISEYFTIESVVIKKK